jgi:hypothetical protein
MECVGAVRRCAADAPLCARSPTAAAIAIAAALLLSVTQDSVTPVRNALAARVGALASSAGLGAELAAARSEEAAQC